MLFSRILCVVNYLLIIIGITCLFFKYRKNGMDCVLSISTWFLVYFMFYFVMPSAFIESINIDGHWGFTNNTITITRLLVCTIFLMYLAMYCSVYLPKNHKKIIICERFDFIYFIANFLLILSIVLCSCFILEIIASFIGHDFFTMYIKLRKTGDELQNKYHIKTMMYLGMASIFYLYVQKKKKIYFILVFLFVISDFLSGTRTNSFVFIIFFYLILVKETGKTFLRIILFILIALLTLSLFSRVNALSGEGLSLNAFVNTAFGEFNYTFLTLPFVIQHKLIGLGNFN